LAVFQLGNNQICILNPETKQLAIIARGRSPVLVKVEGDDETDPPAESE